MNVIMTNPWVFLLTFVWLICGIGAIIRDNVDYCFFACVLTFMLGVGYGINASFII